MEKEKATLLNATEIYNGKAAEGERGDLTERINTEILQIAERGTKNRAARV